MISGKRSSGARESSPSSSYVIESFPNLRQCSLRVPIPKYLSPIVSIEGESAAHLGMKTRTEDAAGSTILKLSWGIDLDHVDQIDKFRAVKPLLIPLSSALDIPHPFTYHVVSHSSTEDYLEVQMSIPPKLDSYNLLDASFRLNDQLPSVMRAVAPKDTDDESIGALFCRCCFAPLTQTLLPESENSESGSTLDLSPQPPTFRKLPSEFWLDLSDLWVCHDSQQFRTFLPQQFRPTVKVCRSLLFARL